MSPAAPVPTRVEPGGALGPELALRARGVLAAFNAAGVLTAADVHVATRLGVVSGEQDDAVLLAAALAVRSTRLGSVVLDLDTAAATTAPEEGELTVGLDWPVDWVARCARSPLVAGTSPPLRLDGSRLWLAKYWEQEAEVARELLARTSSFPDDLDLDELAAGLDRLFPSAADDDQRTAAAVCALSRVGVLAGGPGTGKTTTVSRLLALLREQHPEWRVALAAPTGKAAARLEEAVRSSARNLSAEDRARLGDLPAVTLHRLLGWLPGSRTRFRHDRSNRLPLDVLVVDEASMVSLTMTARLLEALRPATRLVLVGDPDQLASVEAGAVLADLVDRAAADARSPRAAMALRRVLPFASVPEADRGPGVGDGVALLRIGRRFGGSVAALAAAVRDGDADTALDVLTAGDPAVGLLEVADDAPVPEDALTEVRGDVLAVGRRLVEAAVVGDAERALEALEAHRLLCAHRSGPRGAQHWGALAARWLAEPHHADAYAVDLRPDGHYAGEPLLVTSNDYDVGLYNGDSGVVIAAGRDLVAVFGRGGAPVRVPLSRLGDVRPLHAMTVHRSQGSQFSRVTLVLPVPTSPLGTRETLYTALTRATTSVRVVGSREAVYAAVRRPAARATGLRERLTA